MRISALEDYLYKLYIRGNIEGMGRPSVLILGAPGVGKSTCVDAAANRIAKALKRQYVKYSDDIAGELLAEPDKYFPLVDFRLKEAEPWDLLGKTKSFWFQ